MKKKHLTGMAAMLSLGFLLVACSGDAAPEPGPDTGGEAGGEVIDSGSVDALGGQEAADAMTELYEQAIVDGETNITVYGAGENDKGPVYEAFSERFPEITVTGDYLVGPNLTTRMEGEVASGQYIGDIIHSGDTAVVNAINQGWIEPFEPVTAADIPTDYVDEARSVFAPYGLSFGTLYNPSLIDESDVPAGWEDLLKPEFKGKMVSDDVTKNGAGFSAMSKIMFDGSFGGEEWVRAYADQDIAFESSLPLAAQATAAGQYPITPLYPLSFYLRDKAEGAPVEMIFPMEGGVHISPHYTALLAEAPNPTAAKLLITWLFSPEGQDATASIAYYPLMPGSSGPEGYPAYEDLDVLTPFPLDTVVDITSTNLTIINEIFDN